MIKILVLRDLKTGKKHHVIATDPQVYSYKGFDEKVKIGDHIDKNTIVIDIMHNNGTNSTIKT